MEEPTKKNSVNVEELIEALWLIVIIPLNYQFARQQFDLKTTIKHEHRID